MSDLISRADAIEAVKEQMPPTEWHRDLLIDALSALPSTKGGDAETNPIPTGTGVMIQSPNGATHGRLIDADALEIEFDKEADKNFDYAVFIEEIHKIIDNAQTIEALSVVRCKDCKHQDEAVSRVDCSDFLLWLLEEIMDEENWELNAVALGEIIARKLKKLGLLEVKDGYYVRTPSADAEWIPCSERLPKELEAVNVTWVNHNPSVYYQHIKDVPKADTAVYYRGAWYWWDATVIDLLGEYGGAYIHGIEPIDKDIEVTAWMPLPKPYREDGKDNGED